MKHLTNLSDQWDKFFEEIVRVMKPGAAFEVLSSIKIKCKALNSNLFRWSRKIFSSLGSVLMTMKRIQ